MLQEENRQLKRVWESRSSTEPARDFNWWKLHSPLTNLPRLPGDQRNRKFLTRVVLMERRGDFRSFCGSAGKCSRRTPT